MTSQRLLIVGGVLGILAVVLLNLYVNELRKDDESVSVLRLKPNVELTAGTPIDPSQLEPVGLPARFDDVIQQAVPATQYAVDFIRGKPVNVDIPAGSVLRYSHLEDRPEQRFSAKISPGARAVTIPVDATSAVAYFVEPGSRVDVLGTFNENTRVERQIPGAKPGQTRTVEETRVSTRTVLQNVLVLAVGRSTSRGSYLGQSDRGFQNVTLELSPIEAEKVIFAMQHTEPRRELHLALRNPADEKQQSLPSIGWNALTNGGTR